MIVIDRALRILAGLFVLIFFGLLYPTWWCFLGLIPLVTGVSGISLVYWLRGEYKKDKKPTKTPEQLSKEKLSKAARKQKRDALFKSMKNEAIKARKYSQMAWNEQKESLEKGALKPKKRDNKLFSDKPLFND
ncbi:DUF2892 domain-containing protein [Campylobacter corcagiensis]|uniref:DUF2892 domain-containing protein n=1 Tax=Campylobacter corcagiensis TaxID=1448857 RepID=A0A7M1LI91_9BACT|nr:DUF2892 domain-containing protein [Campylobacter corcagiensis]QKF65336.1 DUF2892 domain-containing membrane protein [Campylobacter corcagiensis]QOQ88083.1 DUF2892 domain-containing protein [Campylobacter corcagiensis]